MKSIDDRDVFISFSEIDAKFAERLVDILKRAEITYYYYLEYSLSPSSTNYVQEINHALRHSKVLICILSPNSVCSEWLKLELVYAKNHRLGIVPILTTQFELPDDFKLMIGDAIWRKVDDILANEHYLLERITAEINIRERRNADIPALTPPNEPKTELIGKDSSAAPYPGPRPFNVQMQDSFFGRERENKELIAQLNEARILVLYASSGAGKSSLLNARFAPDLRRKRIDVYPREGTEGPLRISRFNPELIAANALSNGFIYSLMLEISQNKHVEKSARFASFLRLLYRPANAKERVIIIDQFEEIFFTQYADLYQDRICFIASLMEALEDDPSLKIVLSLRKEYLADIETLLVPACEKFAVKKYSLRPIDIDGAEKAITKPVENYVRFEKAALTGLIDQLRQIKVKGPNGDFIYRKTEFIEMAHLQIVCLRLWQSLPNGITVVTVGDVEGAANPGKRFGEFVIDALNQFYIETVDIVAKNVGSPKDHIFFGCSKFVSPQGTRIMLKRHNGRVGRLPERVVESLVDHYLLRRESRGAELWYELSHDLLTEPVFLLKDRDTTALLFATDFLDGVLNKVMLENGGRLENYFGEHRDLLKECHPLMQHASLFSDEQELLLRASIASGIDTHAWCSSVGETHPKLRDRVVDEAIHSHSATVRSNAVRAICDVPINNQLNNVVDISIQDPDKFVRQAASLGLSRVGDPTWWLFKNFLGTRENNERTVDTLAMIYARSVESGAAIQSSEFFTSLPAAQKRSIQVRSWGLRAREAWPLLATIFIFASFFSMLAAVPYKMIPASLDWGVNQHAPQPMIGMFQGAVAGVFWGGLIPVGVTFFYSVFGNVKERMSAIRPVGAIIFGAISGLFASILISAAIIGVFNVKTLAVMGWVTPAMENLNPSLGQVVWESFVTTRFGWVNLITGTGIGIGIALMTNAIRGTDGWKYLLNTETSRIESRQQLWQVFCQIVTLAWPKYGLLCFAVLVAAVCAFFVPDTVTYAGHISEAGIKTKADPVTLAKGLVGDCSTQMVGAFFAVVGMLLGMVVIQHGILIKPLYARD